MQKKYPEKFEKFLSIIACLCFIPFLAFLQSDKYKVTVPEPVFQLESNHQTIYNNYEHKRYDYTIIETSEEKFYTMTFRDEVGAKYNVHTGELLLINETEKNRELWEQLVLQLLEYYHDENLLYLFKQ